MISNFTQSSVDIKITDYCPFGCPFCYQGSTVKGIHADFEELKKAIDFFVDKVGVFEVILGGGEPTLYPHIEDLLLYLLTEKKVNVGITTRNKKVFSLLHDLSFKIPDKNNSHISPGIFVGLSVSGNIRETAKAFVSSLNDLLEEEYRKKAEEIDSKEKDDLVRSIYKLTLFEDVLDQFKKVVRDFRFHLVSGVDFHDFTSLKRAVRNLFLGTLEGNKGYLETNWVKLDYINILLLGYKESKLDHNYKESSVNWKSLGSELEKTMFSLFGILRKNKKKYNPLVVDRSYFSSLGKKAPSSFSVISLSVDFPFMQGILPYISSDKYEKSLIEKEGKYTFYYDAVKKILSESSYSFNFATEVKDFEKDFVEFVSKLS